MEKPASSPAVIGFTVFSVIQVILSIATLALGISFVSHGGMRLGYGMPYYQDPYYNNYFYADFIRRLLPAVWAVIILAAIAGLLYLVGGILFFVASSRQTLIFWILIGLLGILELGLVIASSITLRRLYGFIFAEFSFNGEETYIMSILGKHI